MFGKKKNKNTEEYSTKQEYEPLQVEETEKKKSTSEINDDNKNVKKKATFEFSIEVYDAWDSTAKRLTPFGANLKREGDNSYLVNEDKKFKEMQPENNTVWKQYKLKEVEENIKSVLNDLEKVRKPKATEKVNFSIKDKEVELLQWQNIKRSIETQGKGAYLIFNSEGVPTYQFLRKGGTLLPLYFSVDLSTIYTPSQHKIREITQLSKENDEKNGQTEQIKWATYGLIFILVLLTLGLLYAIYQVLQLPVEVSDLLSRVTNALVGIEKDLNSIESVINSSETTGVNPNVNVVN